MEIIYANGKDHYDVIEELLPNIKWEPTDTTKYDDWTKSAIDIPQKAGIHLHVGNLVVREQPQHPAPPTRIFRAANTDIFSYLDVCPLDQTALYIKDREHKESLPYIETFLAIVSTMGISGHVTRIDNPDGTKTEISKIQSNDDAVTLIDKQTDGGREEQGKAMRGIWEMNGRAHKTDIGDSTLYILPGYRYERYMVELQQNGMIAAPLAPRQPGQQPTPEEIEATRRHFQEVQQRGWAMIAIGDRSARIFKELNAKTKLISLIREPTGFLTFSQVLLQRGWAV